jgi:hypothetical protein
MSHLNGGPDTAPLPTIPDPRGMLLLAQSLVVRVLTRQITANETPSLDELVFGRRTHDRYTEGYRDGAVEALLDAYVMMRVDTDAVVRHAQQYLATHTFGEVTS